MVLLDLLRGGRQENVWPDRQFNDLRETSKTVSASAVAESYRERRSNHTYARRRVIGHPKSVGH
eukprot:3672189-Lingulodinium_polyedra.AAC.1